MLAKASNSIARPWPTGWVSRCSCWIPWPKPSAVTCALGGAACRRHHPPGAGARHGKTRTGRLWVVVRDERPFGSDIPPAAYYRYSPDRKGIHTQALLGRCRGFLHADGYTGFESLYRPTTPDGEPPLVEVACWSQCDGNLRHAPRNSLRSRASNGAHRRPVRHRDRVRGQSPDRRWPRASNTPGRMEELKAFLQTSLKRISGKSASPGNPLRLHTMERADPLLSDGRLEMSNNAAERAMKSPVLGRKNYLLSVAPIPADNAPLASTPSSKRQR